MATVQRPTAKSSAAPQYESLVEQHLARASRRLHGLDVALWALVLACAALVYGLTISVADRLWNLPTAVRLLAWCCFFTAGAVAVFLGLKRLVFRSLNPQFVARQLEQTVPEAKNSIINWLDLRGEPLAPAIRGSLGRRAAKDLGHADAERAISARPVQWMACAAAFLLLVQVAWLLAAPSQALSLLKRAFFPFDMAKIAARTELTLLDPQGGDIAVAANQPVHFRVQAQGYVPALNQKDSLKLHFRYHQNEPFEERALVKDLDGNWTTVVLADQVRNGFWYKITGGDARLPQDREYRVEVNAIAQVLRYETNFKYREYLRLKDRSVTYPKNVRPTIKDLRGTELTLTIHTNRILEQCGLELKVGGGKRQLAGEPVPGEYRAWRFKWVLDQSGEFRILFKSQAGEDNVDRQPCPFEVIPDLAPVVVMTKPAKDLSLPANGTLVVDGHATDDFGVKSMQLRLRILKAKTTPELKPKPYRPDKSFQLVNGKYPLRLDYSDLLALDSLQTTSGERFPLAAGMELEYWIEARDNCDYPAKNGNLGQSTRFKLTIESPQTNKGKAAQDRASAQKQVQEKQKKQDRALDQQNMQAKAEQQKDGAGGTGKGQDQQNSKDQQDSTKQQEQVKDALDKDQGTGEGKGGAKGAQQDKQDKGSTKSSGPQDGAGGDSKDNPPDKTDEAGKEKDGGNQGKEKDSAAAKGKDGGQSDQAQAGPGDVKGAKPTEKSAGKGAPTAQEQVAGVKGNESADKPPPSEDKMGPKDSSDIAGQGKPGDRKDATLDDVAKLREQLEKAGQREPAKKALEKIGEQATDQKVLDAAQKALDEANAQPAQAKDAGPQPGSEGDKGREKTTGPSADPKGGKVSNAGKAKGGQDADAAKAKDAGGPNPDTAKGQEGGEPGSAAGRARDDPRKAGAGKPGPGNQGTVGGDDPTKASPIDEQANRRAGDLQLESLKKQIDKLRDKFTPKVMKELNWTPQDREKFLDKMLAEALVRQQQQKSGGDKLPPPGSLQSQLSGTGPRNLRGGPNQDPGAVVVDRAPPPPEVREAQKIFQGK